LLNFSIQIFFKSLTILQVFQQKIIFMSGIIDHKFEFNFCIILVTFTLLLYQNTLIQILELRLCLQTLVVFQM